MQGLADPGVPGDQGHAAATAGQGGPRGHEQLAQFRLAPDEHARSVRPAGPAPLLPPGRYADLRIGRRGRLRHGEAMTADLPRWTLGIEEASALGLRRTPRSGAPELLALGDESRTVVTARLVVAGRLLPGAPTDPHRVKDLPDDLDRDRDGSQWEGVAGDVTGRVFILRERGSELLVVSPDFRFERRIELHHHWRDDTAYGLEGLLLLRDGHVLAAKQKKPVRLIEFGPAGDAPLGLTAEAWLPPDAPAALSPEQELHQLAAWKFADPEAGERERPGRARRPALRDQLGRPRDRPGAAAGRGGHGTGPARPVAVAEGRPLRCEGQTRGSARRRPAGRAGLRGRHTTGGYNLYQAFRSVAELAG